MKKTLIKCKFQFSRAKVNFREAILRNMLLAAQCFPLWTDFDITLEILDMATSWINLCFSILGLWSRSQLLLQENFFLCSGIIILG